MSKLQGDNTDRYQFDWPMAEDHGNSVSTPAHVIFGINTKIMDENLAAVRSHQIQNEKGETHRPYRQMSHKLSKRPATIASIRTKHDPSVVCTSLIQDAIVAAHLDDSVKLTPAADLLKIIITGSPSDDLYKRTVMSIIVAEMTYFPLRQDLQHASVDTILQKLENQLEDKVARQFVSSILLNASPGLLDGFAWRSIYLSRDKKKVIENIRALQNSLFELREGIPLVTIQAEVEKLLQGLCQQNQQYAESLRKLFKFAETMLTENRYYDQAATLLSDVFYTVNYEPKLVANRHTWLMSDAPLYRHLQRILKEKLIIPEVPVSTIMASSATLVAVSTIMKKATKLMQNGIISDLYNPQVFIESNDTVRAITAQQQNWNPIRPEMAVTVGDMSQDRQADLFCNLNFVQTEKDRQAIALSDSGNQLN